MTRKKEERLEKKPMKYLSALVLLGLVGCLGCNRETPNPLSKVEIITKYRVGFGFSYSGDFNCTKDFESVSAFLDYMGTRRHSLFYGESLYPVCPDDEQPRDIWKVRFKKTIHPEVEIEEKN